MTEALIVVIVELIKRFDIMEESAGQKTRCKGIGELYFLPILVSFACMCLNAIVVLC